MPTFRKDIHLGHEVPMIDSSDINDKVILGRHIMDRVIDWFHIIAKAIRNEHIDDGAVNNRTLADGAVGTRNIQDGAVTPVKVSDDFIPSLVQPLIDSLRRKHDKDVEQLHAKDDDLQNQIDALEIAGVAVSNEFGTDSHIGISQKTLTDAINKIWQKIEDMTGEILQGVNMVVTPTFFVSEDGCDVHVSANTVETNGIFEKIQFFVDGELIHEDTNTEYVSFDYHLDIKDEYDYVIMCKAKIMGIEYPRQQIVTRYNEFYIGAGSTYADIMDSAHAKQLNGTMRHAFDVTFGEGDKLIIIMGASLRDGFIRADLNGAEIAFAEETVTIDGKDYVVFTSEAWSAGDYNIDING